MRSVLALAFVGAALAFAPPLTALRPKVASPVAFSMMSKCSCGGDGKPQGSTLYRICAEKRREQTDLLVVCARVCGPFTQPTGSPAWLSLRRP